MPAGLEPFLPFVVALVVALAATPLAIRIARGVDAVDRPKADRWHDRETPLLGGIPIAAGILVALVVTGHEDGAVLAVAVGALFLHLVGLLDDLKGLRASTKLVAQVVAAGVLVVGGLRAGWPEDPVFAVPLTVLWVVGITNALNLLDNMDGLAAGVAAVCGLAMAACAQRLPIEVSGAAVLVSLAVAGASLGFLPFNVHPARVFMGDAGSLPLGFTLAAASLLATHREAGGLAVVLAAPLLALAVPILDTTVVSVLRKWHGKRISEGGRDHLSHRLVALGMPEKRAVHVLWLATAVLGVGAVAATQMEFLGAFVVFALGLLISVVLGVALGHAKVYAPTDVPAEGARAEELRRTFLNYARAMGPIGSDFVLALAAYAGAYLLRYEGRIPGPDRALLEESLLVVVAVQIAALASCRVYRSVWRYFGMGDAVRLALGVGVGAVLTIVVIVFGWRESVFSRAVFVVDGVLLAVFLFGARALARFVSDAFGTFRDDGVRVLVVGAGEAGTLCLRALRSRGGPAVTPVGIVSDDRTLRHRRIHGVPVVGGTAELPRILADLAPEEVVLATLPDDGLLEEVRETVHSAGLRLTLSPYAKAFVPL